MKLDGMDLNPKPWPVDSIQLDLPREIHRTSVFWNPSPWRHPIQRWRTRPIRRLIAKAGAERDAVPPEMRKLADQIDADWDRAFLFGEQP